MKDMFSFCSLSFSNFSSLVPGAALVFFSSASTVSGATFGITAPRANKPAPASIGAKNGNFAARVTANLPTPISNLAAPTTNFAAKPVKNLPILVPNNKNAANIFGP